MNYSIPKILFALLAGVCAFIVLVGVGDIEPLKVTAAGLLSAVVAILVP